jgi:hypothetical protein
MPLTPGARFSRAEMPVIGGRVMTKLATRVGEVVSVHPDDAAVDVKFPPTEVPTRMPVGTLYDATGLVDFDVAHALFRSGVTVNYVIPGFVHLPVYDLYVEAEHLIAEIGLRGKTRVEVKPRAPRFLEVSNAPR